MKVWREIDRIQQRFIWGGSDEKSKIHWVRWNLVCKSKESGGLGIKSIEEFNLSLSIKWKWRVLVEKKEAVWKKIVKATYEIVNIRSLHIKVIATEFRNMVEGFG